MFEGVLGLGREMEMVRSELWGSCSPFFGHPFLFFAYMVGVSPKRHMGHQELKVNKKYLRQAS